MKNAIKGIFHPRASIEVAGSSGFCYITNKKPTMKVGILLVGVAGLEPATSTMWT